MSFSVLILGSGASLPTNERACSAQLIKIENSLILVDCAENTQIALRRNKISFQKIDSIFISHLHGDHFLGLPGLLFSMHLLGRKTPLKIIAPTPLKQIIDLLLQVSGSQFAYPIEYIGLQDNFSGQLFDTRDFSVTAFPLLHKIETWGFRFYETSKPPKIKKASIKQLNLSIEQLQALKKGEDLTLEDGTLLKNSELTTPPPAPKSYAYCSDTAYTETIIPFISGTDLLYHEATFEAKNQLLAIEKLHSTTKDAALIAQKANVKQLLLGHFSARYKNDEIQEILSEAQEVFPNTLAAYDDLWIEVGNNAKSSY